MSLTAYEQFSGNLHTLPAKRITLGWDGFSDSIVKVIRTREDQQPESYFESVSDFGKYILDKGEKNFSFELEELTRKIGGNMPIMANALAELGARPNCIGTLGHPALHPVFEGMSARCSLFSFADPGITHALEFNGTKILLAVMGALNHVGWKTVQEVIGREKLIDLFSNADLVSQLNWSELHHASEIWKGLLADILPVARNTGRPIGFFDLSDCSKKSAGSILEVLDLLKAFSRYWDVALSLNLNETSVLARALGLPEGDEVSTGEQLFQRLGIGALIIHYSKRALAWDAKGFYEQDSFFLANPKLSTGAGDNFNAGFCSGRLTGLETRDALLTGHLLSSFYMERGRSASAKELLVSWKEKMNV